MALTTGVARDQIGVIAPFMNHIGPVGLKAGAGMRFFVGALLFVETATGVLVPAKTGAGVPAAHRFAGVNIKDMDATGAGVVNGQLKTEIVRGVFPFTNGAGADALIALDLFGRVFAVDDDIVARIDAGATRIDIGQFMGFDVDGAPLVAVGIGL